MSNRRLKKNPGGAVRAPNRHRSPALLIVSVVCVFLAFFALLFFVNYRLELSEKKDLQSKYDTLEQEYTALQQEFEDHMASMEDDEEMEMDE